MVIAHPAVLQDLIEQYESLTAVRAEKRTSEVRRRLEDVSYTLCVSTATREVGEALVVARRQLL